MTRRRQTTRPLARCGAIALSCLVAGVALGGARDDPALRRPGPVATEPTAAPTPVPTDEVTASDEAPTAELNPLPASGKGPLPAQSASVEPLQVAGPQPQPSAIESRPLGRQAGQGGPANRASTSRRVPWWLQTIGALALVIAVALVLRAILQRVVGAGGGLAGQFGAGGRAPSGVLEVLGRYPVARGHTLVLLRLDRRVILLGQTSDGFSTLSEVTDPDEVASLIVKTRGDEGTSITARFNSMLREMETDADLLNEPIEIPDRSAQPAAQNGQSAEQDPASALHHRLLGLRGIEA